MADNLGPLAKALLSEARSAPLGERLKNEMREAISWGVPDHESTGLTHRQLTHLLAQALQYIEQLERNQR